MHLPPISLRVTAASRTVAWLAALVLVLVVPAVSISQSAQAAVPTPPNANTAVVTVDVGADRAGINAVTPLPQVRLGLYSTETGSVEIATCTSDGDGDCNFLVGGTGAGGANRGQRYWVRQISAPDNWFTNPLLRTGNADGTGSEATPYRFQTPPLYGGQTYRSGFDFMSGTGSSNRSASGGIWQQSRNNPPPVESCGLDVALIMDISGSVSGSVNALKDAAATFTDALVGTPSRMALFSFSDNSPANTSGNNGANYPSLTSVSTQAQADAFKARWSSWGAAGGTNWDRGIAQAGAATDKYDIAVMITDGNPSREDEPVQGPGSYTRFKEVEAGIFSANQLKQQGTRMLVFGVGAGASGDTTALNLRAISGDVKFNGTNQDDADYYQTTNYAAVGTALRALALGNCAGSISVTKQIVPFGGTIADAEPAGEGWVFNAVGGQGVTVTPPATRTTTNDGTGTVNFPLTFNGSTSGPVTVQENQQAGYTLLPQNGDYAVCRNLGTGAPVDDVTNVGDPADDPGVRLTVPQTDPVACTMYNRAPPESASIRVDKRWVINGTAYDNGEQPDDFQAQLSITGPDAAPASPQDWGVPRDGYVQGDLASFDETVQLSPALRCTLDSQRVTAFNGAGINAPLPYDANLGTGENEYTITNTMTCTSQLTLFKQVVNGPANPTGWTLTAQGPAGAASGPNGTTGVTADVTAGVPYTLTESGGDARYVQLDVDDDETTRAWRCVQIDVNRNEIQGYIDGLEGQVTVPLGLRVVCTAYNATSVLELRKLVNNDNGGTAQPSDWTLTGTPIDPPPGVEPVSTPGSTSFQSFFVRPDLTYRVTESGPGNYTPSVSCQVFPAQPRSQDTVVLAPLEVGQCTYTNIAAPARLTLVKDVQNGDTGSDLGPEDWTLTATDGGDNTVTGPGGSPEVDNQPAPAGTYQLTEDGPTGYATAGWRCTGSDEIVTEVTLTIGQEATCTIVNTAQPSHLTLVKEVDNAGGGTRGAADWTLRADGPQNLSGTTLTEAVTHVEVPIGEYALGESGPSGYAASEWNCVNRSDAPFTTQRDLNVPLNADIRCVITNRYVPPDQRARLTLVKRVDNTSGGTAEPTDWILRAGGARDIAGVTGSGAVTGAEVPAGRYQLSESGGPSDYFPSAWNCQNRSDTPISTAGEIEVPAGGEVTCAITNTFAGGPVPPPIPPNPPVPPIPPLPPTGGPGFWPLLAGAVLLLGAGVTFALSRRRTGRR